METTNWAQAQLITQFSHDLTNEGRRAAADEIGTEIYKKDI